MLQVPSALIEPQWLLDNLEHENLIVLEATIPKVGAPIVDSSIDVYIPKSIFFDIKKGFSDTEATYPNTVLEASDFEKKARELGINTNSCIVVYDQHGIYSAPRVWWLFHLMGHRNVAVLNGGMPAWIEAKGTTTDSLDIPKEKGNFKAKYKTDLFASKELIFNEINNSESLTIDARGSSRFYAETPEPRPGLRAGHIPNSKNLPYTSILENGRMRHIDELSKLFKATDNKKKVFFSCGSGITACVLAIGYYLTKKSNFAVYDGSWTEWGSETQLPIETV